MRVALAIPYSSVEPSRVQAYLKMTEVMRDIYPWDSVNTFGVGFDGEFRRGASRNRAMHKLWGRGFDVVVLCDADSYPERDALTEAIEDAYEDERIHFPHDRVQPIGKRGEFLRTYGPSAGGCWVSCPEAWFDVGGMEERGGWSVDDRTFLEQIEALRRGPVYHKGKLTCLWHAVTERKVPPEDKALIQEYLNLHRSAQAMRVYLALNHSLRQDQRRWA